MFHRRTPEEEATRTERFARDLLLGVAPGMRTGRRLFNRLPADPRCKLCASPFRGPLAPVFGLIGKKPFPGNPKYCQFCFTGLIKRRAGAEVDSSYLFADVRGSTTLAEEMSPTEFRAAMDAFFATASHVLMEHEAFVDKFVGDEVMAFFIPAFTDEQHALRAIQAGQALLAAVAASEQPLPIGVGVHSGVAFVGTVGTDDKVEFTAMGDPVNVGARLASAAGAGSCWSAWPRWHPPGWTTPGWSIGPWSSRERRVAPRSWSWPHRPNDVGILEQASDAASPQHARTFGGPSCPSRTASGESRTL